MKILHQVSTGLLSVGLFLLALSLSHAGLEPGSKDLGSILFLGDSITQGGLDQDQARTVRSSLYELLTEAGYTFDFTGHVATNLEGLPVIGASADNNLYHYHSGVAGAVIEGDLAESTDKVERGLTQNFPYWWNLGRLSNHKPNLILIMIGTNDVDLSVEPKGEYARLITLIGTIYAQREVGNPTILLASIPPNRNSKQFSAAVGKFNAIIPQVVELFRKAGKDIHFVNQFGKLNANFTALMISPTNLHPNGAGNAAIAETWFQQIAALAQWPRRR